MAPIRSTFLPYCKIIPRNVCRERFVRRGVRSIARRVPTHPVCLYIICYVNYMIKCLQWHRGGSINLNTNIVYLFINSQFFFRGTKDSCALDAMIQKFYHGIQKAVHQFRFKNVEQHLLLGSGGNQNLRPSCRRPPTRTFHTPVGILRLDAPALVWVRSPNDGNTLGWS